MRKLISAVTSLAMAASMASVIAPATVSAADATKGLAIKTFDQADSTHAKDGSTVTISKDEISAGDVVVPCAVYLTESTPDLKSALIQVKLESDSPDVGKVKFKLYQPTDSYFKTSKDYTNSKGESFSTDVPVFFASELDDFGDYTAHGDSKGTAADKQTSVGVDYAYIGYSWINGGTKYSWTGSKSTDYPVFVFDVTLPKGIAEGDYNIGFNVVNTADDGKNINPSTMLEIAGQRYANYPGVYNNLTLDTMKITVGSASSGSTTSSTTTTTTSTTTTTTTTKPNPNPSDADIVFDFGNYEGTKGGKVTVSAKLASGGDKAVASMDVKFAVDSPLTIGAIGTSATAYGKAKITTNPATYGASFASLDPTTSAPITGTEGEEVFKLSVNIPADCPDGVYKVGFGDKVEIYKSGKNSDQWTYSVENGNITVGNPDTTTTTTSTTTTTTTTKPNPSDADIVFDFGEYEGTKGGKVTVSAKLKSGGDKAVASMDVKFAVDSPLTIGAIGTSATAYGKAKITTNPATYGASFASLDPTTSAPITGTEGEEVFKLSVNIPADCPDGDYKVGFGDKVEIYKSGKNSDQWTYSVEGGVIHVGKGTTTTTTDTTTTTTTTTTTSSTTSTTTTTGPIDPEKLTPNWGDANCDGKVNVADVVVLNKWLNDETSYNLTDQGKVNADVYQPQDMSGAAVSVAGVKLTNADSDAIIRSIVHLVELPTQG